MVWCHRDQTDRNMWQCKGPIQILLLSKLFYALMKELTINYLPQNHVDKHVNRSFRNLSLELLKMIK
jgi:hypothetical protein